MNYQNHNADPINFNGVIFSPTSAPSISGGIIWKSQRSKDKFEIWWRNSMMPGMETFAATKNGTYITNRGQYHPTIPAEFVDDINDVWVEIAKHIK